MKPKLYKSLLYSMVGAGMLSLGSCTDLSETIYNQIASEKYEFNGKGCRQYVCAGIFLLAQFLLGMVRVR